MEKSWIGPDTPRSLNGLLICTDGRRKNMPCLMVAGARLDA